MVGTRNYHEFCRIFKEGGDPLAAMRILRAATILKEPKEKTLGTLPPRFQP